MRSTQNALEDVLLIKQKKQTLLLSNHILMYYYTQFKFDLLELRSLFEAGENGSKIIKELYANNFEKALEYIGKKTDVFPSLSNTLRELLGLALHKEDFFEFSLTEKEILEYSVFFSIKKDLWEDVTNAVKKWSEDQELTLEIYKLDEES